MRNPCQGAFPECRQSSQAAKPYLFQNLKTFEELGVSEPIRRAISEIGYEQPMPVQEEVIPYLLGVGNDVIALAQTGTGKTAAYGLPVLQKVNPDDRKPSFSVPRVSCVCRLLAT